MGVLRSKVLAFLFYPFGILIQRCVHLLPVFLIDRVVLLLGIQLLEFILNLTLTLRCVHLLVHTLYAGRISKSGCFGNLLIVLIVIQTVILFVQSLNAVICVCKFVTPVVDRLYAVYLNVRMILQQLSAVTFQLLTGPQT